MGPLLSQQQHKALRVRPKPLKLSRSVVDVNTRTTTSHRNKDNSRRRDTLRGSMLNTGHEQKSGSCAAEAVHTAVRCVNYGATTNAREPVRQPVLSSPILAPKLCDAFLSFFLPPLLGVAAELAQELISHDLSFHVHRARQALVSFERSHRNTVANFTPGKTNSRTRVSATRRYTTPAHANTVAHTTSTAKSVCNSVRGSCPPTTTRS